MPFNEMVISKLKAYVYALADPREDGELKDRVFYIGKGKGNRCFNHAEIARGAEEEALKEREHKLGRIRDIHNSGFEVEVLIVGHDMEDAEALKLEAALIPLLGDTNKAAGQGHGKNWLSLHQVEEAYDTPVQREDEEILRGNVLIVSLNKQTISDLIRPENHYELESATLGDWNLNEKDSGRVDCIVGVKNNLVVSIFATEKDSEGRAQFQRIRGATKGAHGRSRFLGKRILEVERRLRGRSVRQDDKILSKLRPGAGCQFLPAMARP